MSARRRWLVIVLLVLALAGCGREASVVSHLAAATTTTTAPTTTTTTTFPSHVCSFSSPAVFIPPGVQGYSFVQALGKHVVGGDVTFSTVGAVSLPPLVSKWPTVTYDNTGAERAGWFSIYYSC